MLLFRAFQKIFSLPTTNGSCVFQNGTGCFFWGNALYCEVNNAGQLLFEITVTAVRTSLQLPPKFFDWKPGQYFFNCFAIITFLHHAPKTASPIFVKLRFLSDVTRSIRNGAAMFTVHYYALFPPNVTSEGNSDNHVQAAAPFQIGIFCSWKTSENALCKSSEP